MSHQTLKDKEADTIALKIISSEASENSTTITFNKREFYNGLDDIIDRTTTHVLSQVEEVLVKLDEEEQEIITEADYQSYVLGYQKALSDAQQAIKLIRKNEKQNKN